MNLLDMILNTQDGGLVRQIANNFQLDEGSARSAIGALVPALSKGISRNTASPQGLDELIGALSRGNHSQYIDEPESVTRQAAIDDGNGILGHIFGSKDVSRQVASRAAESTGVDTGILKKMLPMLASMAMGATAKRGLASGAAAQAAAPESGGLGSLLTGFLDADKDGSILDDVIGMAGRFMR